MIYCEDGRPSVVAFGFEQWERFGLWSSLGQVANLRFFELGGISTKIGVTSVGRIEREKLADAILETIRQADRDCQVTMAFFYADTECLSKRLFAELGNMKIWTVLMGLDDKKRLVRRYETGQEVGGLTVAKDVDLMWTTWRAGTSIIESEGGRAWYAPEAADPRYHYPYPVARDIDVLFIGQKYGNRGAFVERLRKAGFRVVAYGSGWKNGHLSFDDMIRVVGRSRIVLGIGDVLGINGIQHLKGRDFEMPMCGAAYLTTYNPELADWYEIGKEILCYSTYENCVETLSWALRHPIEIEELRNNALERSLRDHTWEARFRQLFALFSNTASSL